MIRWVLVGLVMGCGLSDPPPPGAVEGGRFRAEWPDLLTASALRGAARGDARGALGPEDAALLARADALRARGAALAARGRSGTDLAARLARLRLRAAALADTP